MEGSPAPEHSVDELPKLLDVQGEEIICRSCRRKWRLPKDGRLGELNFTFLCDHADLHVRSHRTRPVQQWRPTG